MDLYNTATIILVIMIVAAFLIIGRNFRNHTYKSKGKMASVRHCNVCGNNVTPKKDFNWLVFIFMCGIFYLPVYWGKPAKCPTCNSNNFSSV